VGSWGEGRKFTTGRYLDSGRMLEGTGGGGYHYEKGSSLTWGEATFLSFGGGGGGKRGGENSVMMERQRSIF